MLKTRTRLISLRITEEEYEAIRQASADDGSRCVSEFARKALLGSPRPTPEPPACSLITGFDSRLTRVENELAQVSAELNTHKSETSGLTEE